MAVTETTPNPLANLLTSDKYDIRPDVFTADAGGYIHGEPLSFNATTNTWSKCADLGVTSVCDGVLYDAVDINDTKGLVIISGGVRASALIGYSALTDAQKGKVRTELLNKNIVVEDV